MLQFMVREIIRDLDQDGDKKLSLSEFISLPVGTVENQQGQDVDDGWVRDRKREFEELIDANHDGIVTMAELEVGEGPSCAGRQSWSGCSWALVRGTGASELGYAADVTGSPSWAWVCCPPWAVWPDSGAGGLCTGWTHCLPVSVFPDVVCRCCMGLFAPVAG